MLQPIISVIIAAYNQERYITRCLRSLLAQNISRDKFEIVVVNDGSTDNSASVLQEFADEIVLITNESNLGLPASLNKAIRRARTPFVVRVDADDYVNDEFLHLLQHQMKFYQHLMSIFVLCINLKFLTYLLF
jgi:glycosyltransferase involved in cell wall biosynthesis